MNEVELGQFWFEIKPNLNRLFMDFFLFQSKQDFKSFVISNSVYIFLYISNARNDF